jgi:hypothetical protein
MVDGVRSRAAWAASESAGRDTSVRAMELPVNWTQKSAVIYLFQGMGIMIKTLIDIPLKIIRITLY